jgi:hypothetical protein
MVVADDETTAAVKLDAISLVVTKWRKSVVSQKLSREEG